MHKDRVIVIDLTGENAEEPEKKECRCSECKCGKKDQEEIGPAPALQTVYEASRPYIEEIMSKRPAPRKIRNTCVRRFN